MYISEYFYFALRNLPFMFHFADLHTPHVKLPHALVVEEHHHFYIIKSTTPWHDYHKTFTYIHIAGLQIEYN